MCMKRTRGSCPDVANATLSSYSYLTSKFDPYHSHSVFSVYIGSARIAASNGFKLINFSSDFCLCFVFV